VLLFLGLADHAAAALNAGFAKSFHCSLLLHSFRWCSVRSGQGNAPGFARCRHYFFCEKRKHATDVTDGVNTNFVETIALLKEWLVCQ
jgi:hypothetical protein